MKKRFLFYGIVLKSYHILPGNEKSAIGVISNFANATLAGTQFAKMTTSGTKQVVIIKRLE